jgi:DNA-binding LacI/PurR family transcriptional regulator
LGYDVLVSQTLDKPELEEACIRRFISRRVDGMFVLPAYRMATEARVYQELLARKVPTIVLGHLAPFCNQFVNVESDDLVGGYAATQHLLKLGHKRIAFFAGPSVTPWNRERFEGYRRGLREFGLDVDDKLLYQAGRSVDDGAAAALQLINEAPDVTAIQCVNDMVAVGVIETLLSQGIKVPEEMSVVGFGNILLSRHFRVPLTTIRQPKYRLGVAAMEAMQQLLSGSRPEPKRLTADLIIRNSSGTPTASSVLARLKTK